METVALSPSPWAPPRGKLRKHRRSLSRKRSLSRRRSLSCRRSASSSAPQLQAPLPQIDIAPDPSDPDPAAAAAAEARRFANTVAMLESMMKQSGAPTKPMSRLDSVETQETDGTESNESADASTASVRSNPDSSSSSGEQRGGFQFWSPKVSKLARKVYILQREAEERENSMVEMVDMLDKQRRGYNRLESQVRKVWKPKVKSLSQRVIRLQREATGRELTVAGMRATLEQQQAQIVKLFEEEEKAQATFEEQQAQIAKLVEKEEKAQKSLKYWKDKAASRSERLVKAKSDYDRLGQSVDDFSEQRRIQDERIRALEGQLERERRLARRIWSDGGADAALSAAPASLEGGRPFSRWASMDESMARSLSRAATAEDMEEQVRDEARIEAVAVEERLAKNRAEREELGKELRTVRDLLKASDEAKEWRKKKSKAAKGGDGVSGDEGGGQKLVYRLSFRHNQTSIDFVGMSSDADLRSCVDGHFDEVWSAVDRSDSTFDKQLSVLAEGIAAEEGSRRRWSAHLAQHFLMHHEKERRGTKEEVAGYCRENVRVEVLKRQAGSKLFWHDEDEVAMAAVC